MTLTVPLGTGEAAPRSFSTASFLSRTLGWLARSLRGRPFGEEWALRGRPGRCGEPGPGLGEAGRCLATAGDAGLGLGPGLSGEKDAQASGRGEEWPWRAHPILCSEA